MHDMLYGVAPAVSRQTRGGCVPRLMAPERLSSLHLPGDRSLAPQYVLTWVRRSTDNALDETWSNSCIVICNLRFRRTIIAQGVSGAQSYPPRSTLLPCTGKAWIARWVLAKYRGRVYALPDTSMNRLT